MKRLEVDHQLLRLWRRTRSAWKIVQRRSVPLHFPHDILYLLQSSDFDVLLIGKGPMLMTAAARSTHRCVAARGAMGCVICPRCESLVKPQSTPSLVPWAPLSSPALWRDSLKGTFGTVMRTSRRSAPFPGFPSNLPCQWTLNMQKHSQNAPG